MPNMSRPPTGPGTAATAAGGADDQPPRRHCPDRHDPRTIVGAVVESAGRATASNEALQRWLVLLLVTTLIVSQLWQGREHSQLLTELKVAIHDLTRVVDQRDRHRP